MTQQVENAEKSVAARDFYSSVIDGAELMQAMQVEGIDGELAVLRVKLRHVLDGKREEDETAQRETDTKDGKPLDFGLVLKSIELLAKMVAARYRMSPKSADDLARTIAQVTRQIGMQLFPERFNDV